mgnify:CR=1 FL=1
MKSTKIKIASGSEVRISESGYYGFWYPHKEALLLEEEIEVEAVSNRKFVQTDEFVPYFVPESLAKKYGSPINVLWFRKN